MMTAIARTSLAGFLFGLIITAGFPALSAEAPDPPRTAGTLGEALSIFQDLTIQPAAILLVSLLFIGGIWIIWNGLIKLKEASDSHGQQVKYSEGLLRLASGSFLVSIVSVLAIGWASLGSEKGVWTGGGNVQPGAPQSFTDGEGIVAMAANFTINAAGPLSVVVLLISVLVGITLIGSALFGFARISSGQSRETFAAVSGRFIVGVLLTNVYWVVEVASTSFGFPSPFGWVGGESFAELGEAAKTSILSYDQASEGGFWEHNSRMIELALMGVVPFGLIAFVRGLLIIKDSVDASKQASLGNGFVHLIGGIALVNAKAFSCAMMATLVGPGVGWCSI